MRADITITNIPTIMEIMAVMAMVITPTLGLATVTAGAIVADILLIDGIMVEVIRLIEDIMAVIEAVTAEAFTAVIDKTGTIFKQN
jgi:hypothetical protein